jgi:hypothetical protein
MAYDMRSTIVENDRGISLFIPDEKCREVPEIRHHEPASFAFRAGLPVPEILHYIER